MESTQESQPETDTDKKKQHFNTEWQTVKPRRKKGTKAQGEVTKLGVLKRI